MEHFLHYKMSAMTAYLLYGRWGHAPNNGFVLQRMHTQPKKKKIATCNIKTMQVLLGEFPACSCFTIWAHGIVAALQICTYKQYELSI